VNTSRSRWRPSVQNLRDRFEHTLQGVSVPIQECRAATAASEVAAIPEEDNSTAMDGYFQPAPAASTLSAMRSHEWMHRVISLLEAAVGQLHGQAHRVQGTLLEATSLLRQQIDPPVAREATDGRGHLLAWQARKVRDYIDSHITGPVPVADLCALVQRSEAHFSRSFRRTFGYSPHAFVIRCRVELAAGYMLKTEMSLSDIALGCGFVDQAHLCRHFRAVTGETPAAWRRAKRAQGTDLDGPDGGVPSEGVAA